MPISASLASPGPFTAQPIMATFRFLFISYNLSSTVLTISIKSTFVLAQVGQEIKSIPSLFRSRAFRISFPAITSSIGSDVKETLIVSPIPSANSVPIPIADLIIPFFGVPASVTPRCSG